MLTPFMRVADSLSLVVQHPMATTLESDLPAALRIACRLLLAASMVTLQVLTILKSAASDSVSTNPCERSNAATCSLSYWLTLQPRVWIENVAICRVRSIAANVSFKGCDGQFGELLQPFERLINVCDLLVMLATVELYQQSGYTYGSTPQQRVR